MYNLPKLNPGDTVEVIAPASRCSDKQLSDIKDLLISWQLNCIVADDIFGHDLFCANTDEIRFHHLQRALLNPETKAVICARGGYGSIRLIPQLASITPPADNKIFVGMSDTTALQLFLQQQWGWPTIHGAPALDKFSPESIAAIKSILFTEANSVAFTGLLPLNKAAKKDHAFKACITGGNLCLVQAGVGTAWQLDGKDKIILLEEVGERGYRVDRMLEHLRQAGIFRDAAAILFGDFFKCEEPDGTSLIEPTLKRFSESCEMPVVQVKGIGHGYTNFPIPLGTPTTLQCGSSISLTCDR